MTSYWIVFGPCSHVTRRHCDASSATPNVSPVRHDLCHALCHVPCNVSHPRGDTSAGDHVTGDRHHVTADGCHSVTAIVGGSCSAREDTLVATSMAELYSIVRLNLVNKFITSHE